jgi:hypothetical protein
MVPFLNQPNNHLLTSFLMKKARKALLGTHSTLATIVYMLEEYDQIFSQSIIMKIKKSYTKKNIKRKYSKF